MKSDQRHRMLRKQRYNVARELGATWPRAQQACQGGECFMAFLAEVGVSPEPYMHLYSKPRGLIGPVRPQQVEKKIRYRVLRNRGYSSLDAQDLCGCQRSFEQAMEITDP